MLSQTRDCSDVAVAFTPQMLSLKHMMGILRWQPVDNVPLDYRFVDHYRQSLGPTLREVAAALLQELLSPVGSIVVDDNDIDKRRLREMLVEKLQDDELIQGPPWELSNRSYQYVGVCRRVSAPSKVLRRTSGSLAEASVFELLMELDATGWAHRIASKRDCKRLRDEAPYHSGLHPPAPKTWYTVAGRVAILRLYLLALLMAPPGRVIRHFENEDHYREVLGLPPKVTERRAGRLVSQHNIIGEEEWPEDALPQPKSRPRPQRRRQRRPARRQQPSDSSGDSSNSSGSQSGSDPDGSSSSSRSSSSSSSM
jgi:hypothetical protein